MTEPSRVDRMLATADLALRLGKVNRATFHPDGTPESDTTHTVMLGWIAVAVASRLNAHTWNDETRLKFDIGKVATYALVHDAAEAYCGDTVTIGIDAAGKEAKRLREEAAVKAIEESVVFPFLAHILRMYEEQADRESRFVRYLDKVLPKLTHIMNGGAALRTLGFTADTARAAHEAQIADLRKQYAGEWWLDVVEMDLISVCLTTEELMRRGER